MNGIEKITQRIASEANAACLAIAAEWNERCNAAEKEAAQKAQTLYESALAAGKAEAERQAQRLERNVRLDAKKDVLALKQELVSRAFDLAREKLLAMPREQYIALLARLAAQAAVTGEERIALSAADAAGVGEAVVQAANQRLGAKGHLTLASEPRAISGGLILSAGDVEVNCSIDELLEQSRDELAAQVAAILFA